jgi:hypothetical protein
MFHYSDYLREQAAKYRELAERERIFLSNKSFLNWQMYLRRLR